MSESRSIAETSSSRTIDRVALIDLYITCPWPQREFAYRYADRDGGRSRLTEWKLLDELAERCLKLVDYLGLVLAGIDLILSDDGEVFCLEVNTSPAFNYYESHTGQAIAQAIATALARGCRNDLRRHPAGREGGRLLT